MEEIPSEPWQLAKALRRHGLRFSYLTLLMAAFNFFSHGTQDLYPTFLQRQRGLDAHTVGLVAIVDNAGALVGGLSFGAMSERLGRRRAIATAALLALPMIPLWVSARRARSCSRSVASYCSSRFKAPGAPSPPT